LLCSPLAVRGQGWCALCLFPVSCQRMLCPTAPSLPSVAWALLPHLHGYYAPLRLPPCPSRVASLVARFPIPCLLLSFVVSPKGSLSRRSAQTAPGPLVTRSPTPGMKQGDRWLSHVPEFPL